MDGKKLAVQRCDNKIFFFLLHSMSEKKVIEKIVTFDGEESIIKFNLVFKLLFKLFLQLRTAPCLA